MSILININKQLKTNNTIRLKICIIIIKKYKKTNKCIVYNGYHIMIKFGFYSVNSGILNPREENSEIENNLDESPTSHTRKILKEINP